MSTMGCNEFLNQLDAWMDGVRPSEGRAHVRECAHCRGLVEDMDAIRQTAGAWAAADEHPPARVWVSLRAQLEQEGLIRGAVRGEESHRATGLCRLDRGNFRRRAAARARGRIPAGADRRIHCADRTFDQAAQREPLDQRDANFHWATKRAAANRRARLRFRHGGIQSRRDCFLARQPCHC